ncbi:MAG: hypothetical protein RL660_985 [Bacteroidota bacterium]|jgi:hypothetical protein
MHTILQQTDLTRLKVKWFLMFCGVIVGTKFSFAQTYQITYPDFFPSRALAGYNGALYAGQIGLGTNAFILRKFSQASGGQIWQVAYGTSAGDVLHNVVPLNNTMVLTGRTYNHAVNGQNFIFVPLVVITDTNGNLVSQKELLFDTLFNDYSGEVCNSTSIGNTYFHTGYLQEKAQNTLYPHAIVVKQSGTSEPKTIYIGPVEQRINDWYQGIAATEKGTIAIGYTFSIFDTVNSSIQPWLKFIELDTNGNVLQQKLLPSEDTFTNSPNKVVKIFALPNNRYAVRTFGSIYILDSAFNVLKRGAPLDLNMYGFDFILDSINGGYINVGTITVSFFDSNCTLQNYIRFNSSGLGFLEGAVQADDGSIIVLAEDHDGSTLIRTNCRGLYIDSTTCWPTAIQDLQKVDVQFTVAQQANSWLLHTNAIAQNTMHIVLYDLQGRVIEKQYMPAGTQHLTIENTNLAQGQYLLCIYNGTHRKQVYSGLVRR